MPKGARFFEERMTVLNACLNSESLDKALLSRAPGVSSVNLDSVEVLWLLVLHAVVLLAVNQDPEHEPAWNMNMNMNLPWTSSWEMSMVIQVSRARVIGLDVPPLTTPFMADLMYMFSPLMAMQGVRSP